MTQTTTPRMRFPAQALEELKKADPQTPVTLNLIRSLARRGSISKAGDHSPAFVSSSRFMRSSTAPHT